MTSLLDRPPQELKGRPTAPEQRRAADPGHWWVTGATLLAVLASATSLNGVLEPWTWFLPVVRTVAPILLVMAAMRALRLPGSAAALAGLVTWAGALTAQFFPAQSILGVVPGPGTLAQLGSLLDAAEETVVSQVAPVLPGDGILLVACAAIGFVAILVDVLATTLRMPATSGLALLTLMVVPAVVKPTGVGIGAFVLGAAAYLLVLGCAQLRETRTVSSGAPAGFLGRGLAIGSAALAVAVLLPLAIPGFNSGAFPQGARLNVWGSATGLNPAVTLGNDLRNPTGFGRITYATDSSAPLYLRAVTLENFTGRRWEPDQRLGNRERGLAEMGTDLERNSLSNGVSAFTRITTQSYSSPWLLSPYAPVGITGLTGRWSWDSENLSVLAIDGGSTARQIYEVQSAIPQLTREGLRTIGPSEPGAVADVFTDLPEDTPDIVRETTEAVAGGFANPYDKALAIQSYLRGAEFTYSVEAPVDGGYDGSGMDVMARFLEAKAGYCVHYAGTMAVMARAAGIPSRVAVGYTPGTPTGELEEGPGDTELREFVVDSRNAHAWPELYFTGVGWVQFEPTPSRGVVPGYAQAAFSPVGPRADDIDSLNPGTIPDALVPSGDGADQPAGGTGATPGDDGSARVVGVVVGGGLILLLLPLLLRTTRTGLRRRQLVSGPAPRAATTAWAQATELAGDYGHPLLPTDTPRVFAERLRGKAGLQGAPSTSLTRLQQAYEREEYALPVLQRADQELDGTTTVRRSGMQSLWDDVETVIVALRQRSGWGIRLKALLLPRSVMSRLPRKY
ncbi:transglutaminase-like putative cysteine protease [Arthrobacter sp. CAN_A214]|uniref:transglutaminase family protein n=1 Tax=Arthrobacter sp. CAN_A214 TaxID=2787720 RepID=UPI0018CBC409